MKKRWILFALATAVAVAVGMNATRHSAVTVTTATVTSETVEQTISCQGIVEAGDTVSVSLPLDCVLDEVLVEAGQAVKAGDPLFCVDKQATKLLQQGDGRESAALTLSAVPMVVTASADGVIVSVSVPDDGVALKDVPIVVLAPRQGMQVRVMIREKNLSTLTVGQRVRVSGSGLEKSQYSGTLRGISAAVSVGVVGEERLVEGVVELDDGQVDESFRLGLSAKAMVVINTVKNGVVIPYEAVQQEQDGTSYVYSVRDGRAVKVVVTVEDELPQGLLTYATDLLDARVILSPDEMVTDGAWVQEADT